MIISKNNLTNLAVLNTVTGELEQYLTVEEANYLEDNYTSACPESKNRLNDNSNISCCNSLVMREGSDSELKSSLLSIFYPYI